MRMNELLRFAFEFSTSQDKIDHKVMKSGNRRIRFYVLGVLAEATTLYNAYYIVYTM